MAWSNPFEAMGLGSLFDTLLPDFLLAFTFFTALSYAVLGRRFKQQRPAAAMSGAIGLALAVGLVWYEHLHGWSIRDLGHIAIGFAVFVLAAVMFQSLRHIGGSIAGAGLSLGASLLVGSALGLHWPGDPRLLTSLTILSLLGGVIAVLMHRGRRSPSSSSTFLSAGPGASRVDITDLLQDREASMQTADQLEYLRRESDWLGQRDDLDERIRRQLQRMLLVEGALTQRLAQLREKSHLARKGDLHRIEALKKEMANLPDAAKTRAVKQVRQAWKEADLDTRLERLDRTVAVTEKRVRDLTQKAQEAVSRKDYQQVPKLLEKATKLQKHNSQLLRRMEHTEKRLLKLARSAMSAARQGDRR
ncbi:MAG: hypothetical protein ACLFVU_14455 [Phycisphaerae bacterium]